MSRPRRRRSVLLEIDAATLAQQISQRGPDTEQSLAQALQVAKDQLSRSLLK